jgi:eukaryotic translation initiation factor 2C
MSWIRIPALRLEQICADHLGLRDIRGLSKLSPPELGKLRLFLKGLKVVVTLPGHSSGRPKTIKDVIRNVGSFTFDKGGERITVAVSVLLFCDLI